MKRALPALLLLVVACGDEADTPGSPPSPTPSEQPTAAAPVAPSATSPTGSPAASPAPTPTTDPSPEATAAPVAEPASDIAERLQGVLHAPVRIRGQGELGSLTWVAYTVSGIERWMGEQPNREALRVKVAAECANPDEDMSRSCEDVALRSERTPTLRRQHRVECMARGSNTREMCDDMYETEMFHDPATLCRELHVALIDVAQESGVLARLQISPCIRKVRRARSIEVTSDGAPVLLIDVVEKDVHAMDDVVASLNRTLATVRVDEGTLSLQSKTAMGWYESDLDPTTGLCNYTLNAARGTLLRRCCFPPDDDDELTEAENEVLAAAEEAAEAEDEREFAEAQAGEESGVRARGYPRLDSEARRACWRLRTKRFRYSAERGFTER